MLLRDVLKARWSVRVFSHGTSSADEVLIGRPSIGRQVSVDACRFLYCGMGRSVCQAQHALKDLCADEVFPGAPLGDEVASGNG